MFVSNKQQPSSLGYLRELSEIEIDSLSVVSYAILGSVYESASTWRDDIAV